MFGFVRTGVDHRPLCVKPVIAPKLRIRPHRVAVLLTTRVTGDLRLLRILAIDSGTISAHRSGDVAVVKIRVGQVLWHRERVVTSIAENSDQVVALARGMREPAGRSRRIRAGAHAHPGERGASRARDDSVVTSADGGLRAVRVARLRPPHRRLGPDHLDGPGRQNRCPQLGHRGLVAKSVLEPRLETCPGLGQVAQGERDACRADRVTYDASYVKRLEFTYQRSCVIRSRSDPTGRAPPVVLLCP